MADTHGGEVVKNTKGVNSSGIGKRGSGETVEVGMTQKPPLPPRFHIANIQNLLSEEGMFIKQLDKINFLRDQCKEENPYFLAFAETWIKDGILESEYTIYGYEHVASHRKNRDGGGVIIYIREDITYNFLTAVSDEMCSMVAVHLTK